MADSFSRYKEEILAKYDIVKSETYARFLIKPTRAGLRELCIILFKDEENAITVDKRIFKDFMGFEYDAGIQKMKNETDRFRPLGDFLKRETSLLEIAAADMVALLVDFQPRPYAKYLKEAIKLDDRPAPSANPETVSPETLTPEIGSPKVGNDKQSQKLVRTTPIWKRKHIIIITISVAIFAGYALKKEVFPSKECMQWNVDHYEEVICEGNQLGFANINPIFERDEDLLDFKKLKVDSTTVFFKEGQPIVWYAKRGGKCEFFNGPGLHPITGKPLMPITKYMIEKHVLSKAN